jgi:uncharacterized protein (DUF1778 family)
VYNAISEYPERKRVMPKNHPKVKRPALKQTRMQLRLRPEQKHVIAQAARLRQTTLSNFMLQHAYNAAQEVLADQVHFILPPERWREFCRALDAPPRVIPALKSLFSEPSPWDGR